MINQQMYLYKYVQSHIIILHQHVSITPLAIIKLSYNTNAVNIQIILHFFSSFHIVVLMITIS